MKRDYGMKFCDVRRYNQKIPRRRMSASQIIIFGFLALIIIGTVLLILPISSRTGEFTSLETASFTAVSSVCITGLIIEDTMLHWSTFGQVVIIVLIQIGGLGFMTLALLLSMLLKRTITPRERMVAAQSLGLDSNEDTLKTVQRVLGGTFIIESIGALLIATQFVPIFGWSDGIYRAVFHSISAFCNAGFDLLGDYGGAFTSVASFRENYVFSITTMLLVIIGGVGFIVWDDIAAYIKSRRHFRVYTKFVLIITLILIFGGALLIFIFECNGEAFAGLDTDEKILASFFHSVSTRTAGYSSVDNVLFSENTKIISVILMLIGGAAGSTAGGLKVGTVGLVVCSVFSAAAGYTNVNLFRRRVSHENVLRAVSIVSIGIMLVILSTFVITVTDGITFIEALYEIASSIATVGLSLGLTPSLSATAHIICMILMFFGRVGFLTVTYSIMLRISQQKSCITYPEANMLI